MVMKWNVFKSATAFFISVVLLAACASGQVKQRGHNTAIYTNKTPTADGTGKVYFGREIAHVMGTSGGDWLERDTRQQEENVALAISKMPLQQNSVVADVGAGTGYYSF